MGYIGGGMGPGNFNNPWLVGFQVVAALSPESLALPPTPSSPPLGPDAGRMLLSQLAGRQSPMTPGEMALFLQQLFQLPKEIQTLLVALALSPEAPPTLENLKAFLQENPDLKIPLEELQTLLSAKNQQGGQKLMKLLQNSMASLGGASESLGQLVQQSSQLATQIKASPTEALTTLLLLYLPWHPLVAQQKLSLSFEFEGSNGKGDGEASAGEGETLVLFIETNTLGKFRIAVGQGEPATQVTLKVEHDAAAQGALKDLKAQLAAQCRQDGLPEPTWLCQVRTAPPPDGANAPASGAGTTGEPVTQAFTQPDAKKLAIHPAAGVSVLVVQTAYRLARLIFEADDRNRLLFKRAETVNKPKEPKRP